MSSLWPGNFKHFSTILYMIISSIIYSVGIMFNATRQILVEGVKVTMCFVIGLATKYSKMFWFSNNFPIFYSIFVNEWMMKKILSGWGKLVEFYNHLSNFLY